MKEPKTSFASRDYLKTVLYCLLYENSAQFTIYTIKLLFFANANFHVSPMLFYFVAVLKYLTVLAVVWLV